MANELGTGYESRAGVGRESLSGSYGALIAPEFKIPFVTQNVEQIVEYLEDNALHGKRSYEVPTIIGYKTSGPLRVRADYRSSEWLIFAALGGVDTKSGASAPYSHQIDIGDNILRSMSIIIEKDVTCYEIAGAKISSLTLVSSRDGVFWDMELVAYKVTRSTTHRAALAALTYTEGLKYLFHHEAQIRIGDLTNALGTDSDDQAISEFSFALDNKLIGDDQTTESEKYIHVPRCGGKKEATFSFTIPRYEADTLKNYHDNGTDLQMDLIYAGPTLGGGAYGMTVSFPTLKLKALPTPISDDSKIPLAGSGQCYRNNGNTFMSGITEELQIILKNSNDTALEWVA